MSRPASGGTLRSRSSNGGRKGSISNGSGSDISNFINATKKCHGGRTPLQPRAGLAKPRVEQGLAQPRETSWSSGAGTTVVDFVSNHRRSLWRICFAISGLPAVIEDLVAFHHDLKRNVSNSLNAALLGGAETLPVSQSDARSPTSRKCAPVSSIVAFVRPYGGQCPRAPQDSRRNGNIRDVLDSVLYVAQVEFEQSKEFSGSIRSGSLEDLTRRCVKSAGFVTEFATRVGESLQRWNPVKEVSVDDGSVQSFFEEPCEIELRGGRGEPLYVSCLPEASLAFQAGVCEGFELVRCEYQAGGKVATCPGGHDLLFVSASLPSEWCCSGHEEEGGCAYGTRALALEGGVRRFSCKACDYNLCKACYSARTCGASWVVNYNFQSLRPGAVLSRDRMHSPARLVFRSPLWRLPNLSQRQIAERIGLRRVKEVHFRKLVLEIGYAWQTVEITTRSELRNLRQSCDEEMRLTTDVVVKEGTVPAGSMLRLPAQPRNVKIDGTKSAKKQLADLRVPAEVEFGEMRSPARISSKRFRQCLRRSSIYWLNDYQENLLLDALNPTEDDEERYGETAWEMSLADAFVMDSDGHFTHVGQPIKAQHVLAITKALQARLEERASANDFDGKLYRNDFKHAVHVGGVIWLTAAQVDVLFYSMASTADNSMNLADWFSRFRWEPMQAAVEIQRAMEKSMVNSKGNWLKSIVGNRGLDLAGFHGQLAALGVNWLTSEQQKAIFNAIDTDRSGYISMNEFGKVEEFRRLLEVEREEDIEREKDEAEARRAAEAESEIARLAQEEHHDEEVGTPLSDTRSIKNAEQSILPSVQITQFQSTTGAGPDLIPDDEGNRPVLDLDPIFKHEGNASVLVIPNDEGRPTPDSGLLPDDVVGKSPSDPEPILSQDGKRNVCESDPIPDDEGDRPVVSIIPKPCETKIESSTRDAAQGPAAVAGLPSLPSLEVGSRSRPVSVQNSPSTTQRSPVASNVSISCHSTLEQAGENTPLSGSAPLPELEQKTAVAQNQGSQMQTEPKTGQLKTSLFDGDPEEHSVQLSTSQASEPQGSVVLTVSSAVSSRVSLPELLSLHPAFEPPESVSEGS